MSRRQRPAPAAEAAPPAATAAAQPPAWPAPLVLKKWYTPEEVTRLAEEDPRQLLPIVLQYIAQAQQRSQQLEEVQARLVQREAALAELTREQQRQAAPFRVPEAKRAKVRRRPGRAPGHAPAFRPRPEQWDEEATAALPDCCPDCGERTWCEQTGGEQFIEEVPVIRPRVTRLHTFEATCSHCRRRVTSQHPLQVSTALGAAGTHLGPRAQALAIDLRQGHYLTMRKTCRILQTHFGLKLTPGGLALMVQRVSQRLAPQYAALREDLGQAPAVHVDETSWWVDGQLAWLWVFTHPLGTFYVIRPSRGRDVLEEIMGLIFAATLVSDCLSVYDLCAAVRQQKCFSHHLQAISQALLAAPEACRAPERFLPQAQGLLRTALELGHTRTAPDFSQAEFDRRRAALTPALESLLALSCAEPQEAALHGRLSRQSDHLFTFLDHPHVEATNNLAERQLRPAVIARKLSCGNKTPRGALAFMILASLAATGAQTERSFIDCVAEVLPLRSG